MQYAAETQVDNLYQIPTRCLFVHLCALHGFDEKVGEKGVDFEALRRRLDFIQDIAEAREGHAAVIIDILFSRRADHWMVSLRWLVCKRGSVLDKRLRRDHCLANGVIEIKRCPVCINRRFSHGPFIAVAVEDRQYFV